MYRLEREAQARTASSDIPDRPQRDLPQSLPMLKSPILEMENTSGYLLMLD